MEFSFQIDLLPLIIIVLCTISQSIFGIGILLWGTPALMFLNYTFHHTLEMLLPISLLISFSQFYPNIKFINYGLIGKFVIFSIPGLIFGLSIALYYQLDLRPFVAGMLIMIGLGRVTSAFAHVNKFFEKYDNLFISTIGFIHGFSNLGGPLVVARTTLENIAKYEYRTQVSVIYFVFALFQLIILLIFNQKFKLSIGYVLISVGVYLFINKVWFSKISNKNFDFLITILIFTLAFVLLLDTLSFF